MKALDRLKELTKELPDRLPKWIDDAPWANAIVQKLDDETRARQALGSELQKSNWLQKAFALLFGVAIISFFIWRISYYFDWLSIVANDPKVFNLTEKQIK